MVSVSPSSRSDMCCKLFVDSSPSGKCSSKTGVSFVLRIGAGLEYEQHDFALPIVVDGSVLDVDVLFVS